MFQGGTEKDIYRAGATKPRQKGTVMIDLKKARWDLSPEEKYAVKWLVENGFEGELARQYVSKTMWRWKTPLMKWRKKARPSTTARESTNPEINQTSKEDAS